MPLNQLRSALECHQVAQFADQGPLGVPAGDPRLTSDLVAGISRSLSELRGESVHVHLVVLVLRPWSDRAFNHLTHSVD